MLSRRDFLQVAAATTVLTGAGGGLARAAALQALSQRDLLQFEALGQVTLLHFGDIHAHLTPLYYREPSINIGAGGAAGLPPHLTGDHLLQAFKIAPGTPEAYAFTCSEFEALARGYGKLGGLDRIATLVKAIRAERPHQTLLLDSGDTWQGTYVSLQERGADMVRAMNELGVDAMTAHWDFTYGTERVKELVAQLKFPFLCGNVQDSTWGNWAFDGSKIFERGGVRVAVIGQAFPYTPIANPAWLIPGWTFGIHERRVQEQADQARAAGADIVVLLSHDGFDVDRKLAARVKGVDVILTGHTHDAIPQAVRVGRTLLIASGSHGKFLARLDLEVKDHAVSDYRFRLIPVFSDAIAPDPAMAALVAGIRRPYQAELGRVLARTETMLYRRGNFNGTFDDLICDALLAERNAEIALSPGFRWGPTLLAGQEITLEDLYEQTAITYPAAYRQSMTGAELKAAMEDIADNLFNPDPYYQQGGDMVRVGGISYAIDVAKPMGQRISELTLARNGTLVDPAKSYVVAGWASVRQGTQGPPVFDVVRAYLERQKSVSIPPRQLVRVSGADPRGIAACG
ncbi:thiosulfohydrolase SoxB [bacterium]|nr:MAG: thiosulfohydrolase SoxB [bacterium]